MVAAASFGRAVGWYALLAAAPALIGCDFETAGLETLLDSDPSYVNVPGKRLAEGRFSKLEIDGTEKSGGAVLALKNEKELSIVPFSGAGGCSVGSVGSYGLSLPSRSSTAAPFVPFIEAPNESGLGTLRFADFGCALSPVSLPDSKLPLRQLLMFGTEPREFALNDNRELHVLDPWKEAQARIAGAVTGVELGSDVLWTIENGELVERDVALVELRRLGTAVSELVVNQLGQQAAYIDAAGVHLIPALGEQPILLDSDACELSNVFLGRFEAWQWLSYLSPCASRRLVAVQTETRERFELGENASTPAGIYAAGGARVEGHAFYVTDAVTVEPTGPAAELWAFEDVVQVGTLWGGRLNAAPARGPERAVFQSMNYPWEGKLRVVVDFDGVKGRLVEWNYETGSITELAQGVVATNGPEVLANFDGTVGDLLMIEQDLSPAVLAQRVPLISSYGPKFMRSVLADFDGTTGTLLLFDGAFGRKAEKIASGVPLGGFEFMWDSAIVYQDEFDPVSATGRLVARFLRTADTFIVQAGVGEFLEASWPEQGVVYSITEGGNAGVWFARAR